MIRAWHFVGKTLRDGSPIPKDGVWLKHKGEIEICSLGFHASRDPLDALQYAPGDTICLVDCRGDVIEQDDKLVCRERRIVARMDANEMLQYFARMQAVSVVEHCDAQDVVIDYLMTGDEKIRDAACDSARSAAESAAWAAAGASARAAAWDAAWDSARAAARKDFNELVNECFEGVL